MIYLASSLLPNRLLMECSQARMWPVAFSLALMVCQAPVAARRPWALLAAPSRKSGTFYSEDTSYGNGFASPCRAPSIVLPL